MTAECDLSRYKTSWVENVLLPFYRSLQRSNELINLSSAVQLLRIAVSLTYCGRLSVHNACVVVNCTVYIPSVTMSLFQRDLMLLFWQWELNFAASIMDCSSFNLSSEVFCYRSETEKCIALMALNSLCYYRRKDLWKFKNVQHLL